MFLPLLYHCNFNISIDSFESFAFLTVFGGISGCLAERAVTILVLVCSFRQLAVAFKG